MTGFVEKTLKRNGMMVGRRDGKRNGRMTGKDRQQDDRKER